MSKKKEKGLKSKVDKAQDAIEKSIFKKIQKDYESNVPIFIKVLKILIIISIVVTAVSLLAIINIFPSMAVILVNLAAIAIQAALLYGLNHRKRWSLYYGIILYALGGVGGIITKSYFSVFIALLLVVLLYFHKDYLNK